MKVTEFLKAVKTGNQLADPAAGKAILEKSNLAGPIVGGFIFLVNSAFPDLPISDETVNGLIVAVSGVVSLVTIYLNRATTKKSF